MGLLGLPVSLCCSWFALLFTVGALATGIAALVRISGKPDELKGKGLAIAGIVCGLIVPVLIVLFLIFSVALFSLPVLFS